MRQAIDYPSRDWIGINHHHDGDRFSGLLGCEDRRESRDDEHIDLELHEFSNKAWETFVLSLDVAILNVNVFLLDVTEIAQSLTKCFDTRPRIFAITAPRQKSYTRDFLGQLLRLDEGNSGQKDSCQ